MRWFSLHAMALALLTLPAMSHADTPTLVTGHSSHHDFGGANAYSGYSYSGSYGHGAYGHDGGVSTPCDFDYYLGLWAGYCYPQHSCRTGHCIPFGPLTPWGRRGVHAHTNYCTCGKLGQTRGCNHCRQRGGCAQGCASPVSAGETLPDPVQPEVPPESWEEDDPSTSPPSDLIDPSALDESANEPQAWPTADEELPQAGGLLKYRS